MTLIFSNENRILFNVKKTGRLIELNYGNRFTCLLDSKNRYNITTTRLQNKLNLITKDYTETTQRDLYKGAYEKKDLKKKSEQTLSGLVKTAKTDCFALQTFSKNEILSLYGFSFGQTILTQNFFKNYFAERDRWLSCQEKAILKKAFNPKITIKKGFYTASKTSCIVSKLSTYSFLIPLKRCFSFFSQKKRKYSINQGQNKEKETSVKHANTGYQELASSFFRTDPISFLKQNAVLTTQKGKRFVPHTIKTTIWGFTFGSSFLLLSMATILQRQNGNRWFFPFLKTQMPGLYQDSQESSWESFENITRKYINRDSTPFCLPSYNDMCKRDKEDQKDVQQQKPIFLPFQFTGNRTNREMQTLIKNVDFYKDQFYIDFSEPWNQQHVQSFAAIFSKPRSFGKNTCFHNSKTGGAKKKWKRKRNACPSLPQQGRRRISLRSKKVSHQETLFLVQPGYVLNARIPPKKPSSKKTFINLTPKKTGFSYKMPFHTFLLSIFSKEQSFLANCFKSNRTILQMQKETGLFKAEQYKKQVSEGNDSIPSKMASSLVEKKTKHVVHLPSEIVKKLFYEYGVFSIAAQALQTSSQENLMAEPPAPAAPFLIPPYGAITGHEEKGYIKESEPFYNFPILLKDVAQPEKLSSLKPFKKEIVKRSNDKRLVSFSKEKLCTTANRLPIERISNHSFYKQNKISNRFMSGYQIPEIKALQLRNKTSKKQFLGVFKEKAFFYNNSTFFSRFQFPLRSLSLSSSCSSLLHMNKVCIKVPPALPFYESKVQNLVKTFFCFTEPFFLNGSWRVSSTGRQVRGKVCPSAPFYCVGAGGFVNKKQDTAKNCLETKQEPASFSPFFPNNLQLQNKKQNVNQINQINKGFKTDYSINPLKKMPYREISLKSFQEIKPLFEQVNREVRISPYQFRFKKPLFLDYKDYLSWKKDTPAAISISPSLEEDEAIKTSWDENFESELQSKQELDPTSLNLVPFDEVKKDLQQRSGRGKDGKSSQSHVDQSGFDFEDTIDSQTSSAKNPLNETSQETETTTGEEEEKKKEITKLEWLISVREAEQPVEERKDFQKLAYPNKKALFSKNLLIEQGKLENLLVKDRKDSFFGITNLFPKRLVAQDQKQINYQILQDEHDRRKISFFDLLKSKKPDADCFSSYSPQKSKNRIFVEDILGMGFLNQLQNKTDQTLDRQEKTFLKTQEDLYNSNKSNASINATKRSVLKRIAPRNRKTFYITTPLPCCAATQKGKKKQEGKSRGGESTKTNEYTISKIPLFTPQGHNKGKETQTNFGFAFRQHPVYTSNRRLRLRVSESLLSPQNNNPQSRIDDLNLSQSHRWWQKRRTTSSLLGAPSKRYLVMPEITAQDWRNIIEWQLKTYFLEEEKRLQLLVLEKAENKRTDLSRGQAKDLLPSSPPCAGSVKGRDTDAKNLFKVKKIAIYLPWATLKKSVKKPFEWPLTSLSYQSVKDGKRQNNYPIQKLTPFEVSRGTPFLSLRQNRLPLGASCSQKQDVLKKVTTNFANKKTDFCFVSSISPQFKTSPFFIDRGKGVINHNQIMMQNKTFYCNVTKKQLEKSQVYKPFLFEPVRNDSYLLLHQLLLAIAIKDLFKSIYKVFGKVILNRIKNSSLVIRFLPIFSKATSPTKRFNLFYPLKKRFKDLVGSEDTISSLSEIVWYLRNSCRGRMVPHGVVLVETVSSETSDFLKAIGGEAQVPVIVQSLRALPFTQNHPQRHLENILTFAQKRRPCILFLDDLDSIGQSRTLLLKNNRSLKNNFYEEHTTAFPNSSSDSNYLTSHGDNVFNVGTFEKQKWKKLKNNFKQEHLGPQGQVSLLQRVDQDSKFNFKSKQGKESDQFLFSSLLNKRSISQVSHNSLLNNLFSNDSLEKQNTKSVYSNHLNRFEGRGSFATRKNPELPVFQNEDFSNSEDVTGSNGVIASQQKLVTKSNKPANQTEKIVNQRRTDLMLRLLTVMDGISHLNGVLIVTTSKNPSSLDPALLRPGRFERLINLQLPNKKRRIELLKIELSKIGHTNPMPWSYFGTRTQDMTGTEIASAINHSAFRAIIQSTVHTATTLEYGIKCVNGEDNTSLPLKKSTKHLPYLGRCKKRRMLFSLFHETQSRVCPSLSLDRYQNETPRQTRFNLRRNCNKSFFRTALRFNENVRSIFCPALARDRPLTPPKGLLPTGARVRATALPVTRIGQRVGECKVVEGIVHFKKLENNKNKKRLKSIVVHNPYQFCSDRNFQEIPCFKHGFGKNKHTFSACSARIQAKTESQLCFLKKKNEALSVPMPASGGQLLHFSEGGTGKKVRHQENMRHSKAVMDSLKVMHEMSSQIPFYQAGKAMIHSCLASEHRRDRSQLHFDARQQKHTQANARDFALLRKTVCPFSTVPLKVNKKTCDKAKICTKKCTRKSSGLSNAHCYNLTRADFSQNTIGLFVGQASKLLYLDSIPRFKKKRFLKKNCAQNKKSLHKRKMFRTFFEQRLFLQSDISYKERLKATLLIDLMLNNFEMYKKRQAFYLASKAYVVKGFSPKVLSSSYFPLFLTPKEINFARMACSKRARGAKDRGHGLPCVCLSHGEARHGKNEQEVIQKENKVNKKHSSIFKGFKSKKSRKSTHFLFFNKNLLKRKICYQDLRKYLLVNQTAEPDRSVLFSNKAYKDFWWGEKVVDTLKILKQPLGNWYRLYLPRLEQNKSNREWLFPDKIFNQHISLLDLNRLMHYSFAMIPSLTFLQAPAQTQPFVFNCLLKGNQSVLLTKRTKKRFEPSFCRKTKNLRPICNSCQKFYSLQKEKTSRLSYYNMVLSCFYLAFQNCTENRELLDLLADHLIRFKLLRLHEIRRISSFYFY